MIIKITTPWEHNYITQINPNFKNKYRFEINNECEECDLWFIWGGILKKTKVFCNPNNIFYITDEAHYLRKYNSNFLNQFSTILSVRKDLEHRNIVYIFEPQIWYFNKSFEEIKNIKSISKQKLLSVVSSNLTILEGHKKRFAFVNKLIGHFKDKIDVYGRGINPIKDKWDALAPYKFSIAIENNVLENYFTEKISECYLAYCMPIYYGCPNIKDFYTENSMVKIDIENYKEAIEIIESVIYSDFYENNLDKIVESRYKYLNEYHFFAQIINLIEKKLIIDLGEKKYVTIYPENYFDEKLKEEELIKSFGTKKLFKLFLKSLKNKI